MQRPKMHLLISKGTARFAAVVLVCSALRRGGRLSMRAMSPLEPMAQKQLYGMWLTGPLWAGAAPDLAQEGEAAGQLGGAGRAAAERHQRHCCADRRPAGHQRQQQDLGFRFCVGPAGHPAPAAAGLDPASCMRPGHPYDWSCKTISCQTRAGGHCGSRRSAKCSLQALLTPYRAPYWPSFAAWVVCTPEPIAG